MDFLSIGEKSGENLGKMLNIAVKNAKETKTTYLRMIKKLAYFILMLTVVFPWGKQATEQLVR